MHQQTKSSYCSSQTVFIEANLGKQRTVKKRLSGKQNIDDFFAKMKNKQNANQVTEDQCKRNPYHQPIDETDPAIIKRHLILTQQFLNANQDKLQQKCNEDPFLKRQAIHFYKSSQKSVKKGDNNLQKLQNQAQGLKKLDKINFRIDKQLNRVQSIKVLKKIRKIIQVKDFNNTNTKQRVK